MIPKQLQVFLAFILVLLLLFIAACNNNSAPEVAIQLEPTATLTNLPTNTPSPTLTPLPPTDTPTATSTPTNTPTPVPTATSTPAPTATPTATDTPVPTATNTVTPLPTDTPTLPPPPADTPTPEPIGHVYPPIPEGKGLLYVINYHSDEAQFYFFDREGEYLIPGKRAAPDGGVLELFLDPGHYRWAGVVQFADLRGEGEFDIAAGQIYGLGLTYGKVGPQDVLAGLTLGPDPLSPPVTPSPTPIPTPPAPSSGKVMLVLISGSSSGDILFSDKKYPLEVASRLFLELEPGFYDINYVIVEPGGGDSACGWVYGAAWGSMPSIKCHPSGLRNAKFQITLPADSVCDLFVDGQLSDQNPNCNPVGDKN